MTEFRAFLLDQMNVRGLNKREFARFLGISESSLYNYIHKTEPKLPNDETLLDIARATSIPISTLIELRDPGLGEQAHLSAHAHLLAQEYENLTVDERRIIDMVFENFRGNRTPSPDEGNKQ